MAVRTMCRSDVEGAFLSTYYGRSQVLEPYEQQLKEGTYIGPYCNLIWMEESFKGAVLHEYERNGYDDSDWHVVVWDDEKNQIEDFMYATTRGWSYPNGASVDATEEVKAKAAAWAYNKLRKSTWQKYLSELARPEKGDLVTVVKGRKVAKGTTGTLFWIGQKATYGGYSRWSQTEVTKCGVALDDEKDERGFYKNVAWTYLENLEADVKSKFRYSEIKRRLKGLRQNSLGAWMAYYRYGGV